MATMTAARVDRPRGIRMDKTDVPEIGPHDILVQVRAVILSESDVHRFKQGPDAGVAFDGYLRMPRGIAGEIVGVGSDVEDYRAGQRVAVNAWHPCLRCSACRAGEFVTCSETDLPPTVTQADLYVDHLVVPARPTWVLPDRVPWDECAMVVPLSVGFRAARRANLSVGQTVGIIGATETGLMCLLASRISGASRIVVFDAYPRLLAAARRLGATDTVDTSDTDALAMVDEATAGRGLAVVFETTGRPGSLMQAMAIAGCGSSVVVVGGMPPVAAEIPAMDLIVKEIDLRGVFPCAESPEPAVTVLARGMVDVRAAITERFGFEQIEDALRFADKHEEDAVKVMVEF